MPDNFQIKFLCNFHWISAKFSSQERFSSPSVDSHPKIFICVTRQLISNKKYVYVLFSVQFFAEVFYSFVRFRFSGFCLFARGNFPITLLTLFSPFLALSSFVWPWTLCFDFSRRVKLLSCWEHVASLVCHLCCSLLIFHHQFVSFLLLFINFSSLFFSYCSMTFIVDQLFPPIIKQDEEDYIEYTSFNYWRDPVNDLDLDISVASPSPTPENGHPTIQLSKPLATIPEI